jgi:hypothetical protein
LEAIPTAKLKGRRVLTEADVRDRSVKFNPSDVVEPPRPRLTLD